MNIIGASNENKIVHSMIFEGTCTKNDFKIFIIDLMKIIKKNAYIVLDNASIHNIFNDTYIKNLLLEKNIIIKFLPTYSPDFNPIENIWAWIKNSFRKLIPTIDSENEKQFISILCDSVQDFLMIVFQYSWKV